MDFEENFFIKSAVESDYILILKIYIDWLMSVKVKLLFL